MDVKPTKAGVKEPAKAQHGKGGDLSFEARHAELLAIDARSSSHCCCAVGGRSSGAEASCGVGLYFMVALWC